MDREIEFIKLKVDWYKSLFPWVLAMIVGALAFARSLKLENELNIEIFNILITSVIFLLLTILSMSFASQAFIHRLEAPHTVKNRYINLLIKIPHGKEWESFFASFSAISLSIGIGSFIYALTIHANS